MGKLTTFGLLRIRLRGFNIEVPRLTIFCFSGL
jgi:hypothetical protein